MTSGHDIIKAIGLLPSDEQGEVIDGVESFLTDRTRRVLILEAEAGIGKTLGVSIPACLRASETWDRDEQFRILYVTNTKKNRDQVFNEFLRIQPHIPGILPLQISSRYDYLNITLFKGWIQDNQHEYVTPYAQVEADIDAKYDGQNIVLLDEFREFVAPVADFYNEGGVPWLGFAASPDDHHISKEERDSANVEIITQAMFIYNRRYKDGVKKGRYQIVIIDEMDQLISVCEGQTNVKVNLDGIITDLKALGMTGILKIMRRLKRRINTALGSKTESPYTSDCGFPDTLRKATADDFKQANKLWEIERDDADQNDPKINMLDRKWMDLVKWMDYTPEEQSNYWSKKNVFVQKQGKTIRLNIDSIDPGTEVVWLWRKTEKSKRTKIIAMSACMGAPSDSNSDDFLKRYPNLAKQMAIGSDLVRDGLLEYLHVLSKYKMDNGIPVGHGTAQFYFPTQNFPQDNMFNPTTHKISGTYIRELVRTITKCRQLYPNERIVVLAPAFGDIDVLTGFGNFCLPNANFIQRRNENFQELIKSFSLHKGPAILFTVRWEGLNLPGLVDNLIITRLPFSPPASDTARVNIDRGIAFGDVRAHSEITTNVQFMVRRTNQGLGRGIRRSTNFCRYWLIDPRIPLPYNGSRGSKKYIAMYPERFRDNNYHTVFFRRRCVKLHQNRKPHGKSMERY